MTKPDAGSFEVKKGILLLRGIPIEHCDVIGEVGRGANGIVFETVNRLLDRREALKIWLRLRPRDTRNRIEQGMAEARQASTAAPAHAAVIYHASIIGGVFYATMEFVDGFTLKSALDVMSRDRDDEGRPRWDEGCSRLNYARAYIDALRATSTECLLHGDPHWSNVILVPGDNKSSAESYATAKLVDFGTSHFTVAGQFEARHWRVVDQTLDRILEYLPDYRTIKERLAYRMGPMHPRKPDYFSELMLYMADTLNKLE